VTGPIVRMPRNLKVRIGTRIGDLIEECGGFSEKPDKIILGGAMSGYPAETLETPVTKCLRALIAFGAGGAGAAREWPCISCGRCADVCPWGLAPARLFKLIEHGAIAAAGREGLSDCTECGSCAYACPSRIPLVASMRRAKQGQGRA